MALRKEEIMRKVLHFIFGTIIPVGVFYIPYYAEKQGWHAVAPWLLPPVILAVSLAGFILVEIIRFRVPAFAVLFNKCGTHFLRQDESHKATGATYINAAALICSLIFRNCPYISFMVLSTFIWGDAVAALVGQSIGRIKIGKKSLEGSIGCLSLCLIFFFGIFPHVPLLLDAWNGHVPVMIILIASLCITIMELFPIKITSKLTINDNLSVPVITGVIMVWLYPVVK